MGIVNNVKNKIGVVTVQIEGFFTERFINLCKINNVKIWDIRNIVKGVIRFKINIYDFKKLKKIARKTKCKVIIKNKKGLYFTLFKYRKRRFIFFLVLLAIAASITFSTFIWQIEIKGNINVSNDQIINELKNSGIYIGKNKIGIDKKEVINNFRVRMNEISWIGLQIEGSKAIVEIVEKTKLDEKDIQNTQFGNIVATKSGLITKIIPENGTAVFKAGSFIEKDTVAIEGTIYSKYIDPIKVVAKGFVKADCEYVFEKEYSYEEILRNYINKIRYTVGITINSKENMLNYLNKTSKYDITKESKYINLFGNDISFDIYKCREYEESSITKTKEELIQLSNIDIDNYLNNEILPSTIGGVLVDKNIEVVELEGKIKVVAKYVVNEEIGKFVEGEPQVREKTEVEGVE